MRRTMILGCSLVAVLLSAPICAQQVKRYPIPNSHFPISAAVEIPPGKSLVLLSGMVPPVVDEKAAKGSAARYGDTETQTVGVLKRIQGELETSELVDGRRGQDACLPGR